MIRLNSKKQDFLSYCSILLALFLIFPSGAFLPSTKQEDVAHYLANYSREETTNSLTCLSVETSDGDAHPIESSSDEYKETYGIFRDSLLFYVGTVNASQSEEVFFPDYKDDFGRLSFLYSETNSNRQVLDSTGAKTWRHEYYDFELWSQGNYSYASTSSGFCSVTQDQADVILEKKGVEKGSFLTVDDFYSSLIGAELSLSIKGQLFVVTIANIIKSTGYLFSGCQQLFGNFLLVSPKATFISKTGLSLQATYFFNVFDFQNNYKLTYLNKKYSDLHYEFIHDSLNSKAESEFNDGLVFACIRGAWNTSISLFSVVLFLSSLTLLFYGLYFQTNRSFCSLKNFLFFVCSLIFIPYLLFALVFKIFDVLSLFSSASLAVYFVSAAIVFIVTFIRFWKKTEGSRKTFQ